MNILFLDPVTLSSTATRYTYYNGLFFELQKQHNVYHYTGVPQDFAELEGKIGFKADYIVFGLGWFKHKCYGHIKNLNIPSACFLFKPQNQLAEKLEFCRINNVDLILTPVPEMEKYEEISGVRTELFPYGFDPLTFSPRPINIKYDIGFSGALHQSQHYPNDAFHVENLRPKIGALLQSVEGVRTFWKSSDVTSTAYVHDMKEYAATINSSRMWIATLAAYGDVTPRFYEVLGSGTLLFCQQIPEAYKFLLKDDINCVTFKDDLNDFEEKIRFYINHPDEAARITQVAAQFFHNHCTWSARAGALCKQLAEL